MLRDVRVDGAARVGRVEVEVLVAKSLCAAMALTIVEARDTAGINPVDCTARTAAYGRLGGNEAAGRVRGRGGQCGAG